MLLTNTAYGINRGDAKYNDEIVQSTNPVEIAIRKFHNHHLSVKLIRDNITLSGMFQFESVSLDDILKEITNFKSAKNGTFKSISTR